MPSYCVWRFCRRLLSVSPSSECCRLMRPFHTVPKHLSRTGSVPGQFNGAVAPLAHLRGRAEPSATGGQWKVFFSSERCAMTSDGMAEDLLLRRLGDTGPGDTALLHILIGVQRAGLARRVCQTGVRRLACVSQSGAVIDQIKRASFARAASVDCFRASAAQYYALMLNSNCQQPADAADGWGHVAQHSWSDGVCARVVGVACDDRLFRQLAGALVHRSNLMARGRVEFLHYVGERMFNSATDHSGARCNSKRYMVSILLNMLMDFEVLDSLSIDHFVCTKKFKSVESRMLLVRMVPKVNTPVPASQLPALTIFLQHCFSNRNGHIIEHFEGWIPDSGPRLIRAGFKMFQPFSSLSLEQLLPLFRLMTSWPEYHSCFVFQPTLQQQLQQQQQEEQQQQQQQQQEEEEQHQQHQEEQEQEEQLCTGNNVQIAQAESELRKKF